MAQACNLHTPQRWREEFQDILSYSMSPRPERARWPCLKNTNQPINQYTTIFEGTQNYLSISVSFKLCSPSPGLVKGVHEADIFFMQLMAFHNNAPCREGRLLAYHALPWWPCHSAGWQRLVQMKWGAVWSARYCVSVWGKHKCGQLLIGDGPPLGKPTVVPALADYSRSIYNRRGRRQIITGHQHPAAAIAKFKHQTHA